MPNIQGSHGKIRGGKKINRAERRSLEKKGRLEKGDLKRISNDIAIKTTNDAFRLFILTSVFALRDEFGFGEGRINKFIDAVNKKVCEYNEGCFTIDDLQEAMKLEVAFGFGKVKELKRAIE